MDVAENRGLTEVYHHHQQWGLTVPEDSSCLQSLVLSIGKKYIAMHSHGANHSTKVWRIGGQSVGCFQPKHPPWFHTSTGSCAFSPTLEKLLAVASGGNIELWDVAECQYVGKLTNIFSRPWCGWREGIPSISFSPDGKLLASANAGGNVSIWDVERKRHLYDLNGPGEIAPNFGGRLAWDDNEWRLVVGAMELKHSQSIENVNGEFGYESVIRSHTDTEPVIHVWDLRARKVSHEFRPYSSLQGIESLGSGKFAIVGRRVSLLDLARPHPSLQSIGINAEWPRSCANLEDRCIAIQTQRAIEIWDLRGEEEQPIKMNNIGVNCNEATPAFVASKDGAAIVTVSNAWWPNQQILAVWRREV